MNRIKEDNGVSIALEINFANQPNQGLKAVKKYL